MIQPTLKPDRESFRTPPARTCPQYGIKPFQTGLSVRQARWRSPGSRACCFSACAGSQTTQGQLAARDSATSRVAFPVGETVGVPGSKPFRSSIARPTDALVYASTHTSRCQSQDSGSRWSRSLLSCGALSSPTTCRFIPAHPQIGFELATHNLTAERAPERTNRQSGGLTPGNSRCFACSNTDRRGFVVWLFLPVSSSET